MKALLFKFLSRWQARFDPMFGPTLCLVVRTRNGSVAHVQRHLLLPYRRTARIFDELQALGLLSSPGAGGVRQYMLGPNDDENEANGGAVTLNKEGLS